MQTPTLRFGRPAKSNPCECPHPIRRSGAAGELKSGLLYFVTRIRDRRFVAVDEERGLVLAFGFFDHSGGEFRNAVTPEGKPVTGGPVQPWTWYIVELFKVENGKLGEIEALLQQVPYGMLSGWSTYEAGMSSELQDVTLKIK